MKKLKNGFLIIYLFLIEKDFIIDMKYNLTSLDLIKTLFFSYECCLLFHLSLCYFPVGYDIPTENINDDVDDDKKKSWKSDL